MKFYGVFVALFAQILVSSGQYTLENEFHEILQSINMEKIHEITREYFENDRSVQALIKYIYSEKYNTAWEIFVSSPEVDDIFEWMRNRGVNIASEIKIFAEEVEKISSRILNPRFVSGYSLKTFEEEIKEQVDFEKLEEKIDELLENGDDLTHLYLILSVTQTAIEKVFDEPEIVEVMSDLMKLGVNLEGLKSFVYKTFRWD